ncbi:acyl-ACP desaturase [Streptomyces niveus]|uniref:acyl-ACP desaturase n=1 Tax=Streptomyces niveus TaxID=193462 RepID=UPI00343AC8C5
MTSRALREAFHREYMTFFERAERTRRWNLFEDVPWDRLDEVPRDDRLALCAETFCGVEMFLPDYLREHLSLLAGDYGQAWFAANWGYEEAKHSLVLREYLRRTGQRTEDQLHDYAEQIMARRWRAPHDDPRRMTAYLAVQELTTFVIYRKQRELARRTGDPVLAEVYRFIARDEMAHSRFYQRMLALHLDDDRVTVMRTAGVDARVFFTEVVLPLLAALGLSRGDLFRVPAETARTGATLPARTGATLPARTGGILPAQAGAVVPTEG